MSDEKTSAAGMAALLLTQQLYLHAVLSGDIEKQHALEIIDAVSRQAEQIQLAASKVPTQAGILSEDFWKHVRSHIEASYIQVRVLPAPGERK